MEFQSNCEMLVNLVNFLQNGVVEGIAFLSCFQRFIHDFIVHGCP